MRIASALLYFAALAACKPTVYLIRHGEKSRDPKDTGLNAKGEQRAECLRTVFGPNSEYNIGHVMAQAYKKNGRRKRPYDTVLPLANDLGLKVDTSCKRGGSKCVRDVIENYTGQGNILICWQHKEMRNIADDLGVKKAHKYPKHRYDLIWEIPHPYKHLIKQSEMCSGLDVVALDTEEFLDGEEFLDVEEFLDDEELSDTDESLETEELKMK